MAVRKFGVTPDGREVHEIALRSHSGACASIITFGASVRDLQIPLPDGSLRRVVLGYRDLAGYLADTTYMGAIVGRNANRIGHGRFRLDGSDYQLPLNEDGRHHLHGGHSGFFRQVWEVAAHEESAVTLALRSPDGDEGYPGTVSVHCEYRLVEPAALSVRLTGETDAPTLLNLAQHAYFTLAYGQPIGGHWLNVNASAYTPADAGNIPTGEIRPVAGTRYDFRKPKPISDAGAPPLDINFVLDRAGEMTFAAAAEAPDRLLRMEVHTTEPGLQAYDGHHLSSLHPGLDDRPHFRNAGFCLEPQKFPDAINHPDFAPPVLRPGERYWQLTEYRFTTRGA